LYSFWNKFLKDKGFAPTEEPLKMINQGMILGLAFVYVSWSILYTPIDGVNVERCLFFISKTKMIKSSGDI
jgi:leucyl-tRNA synthetase